MRILVITDLYPIQEGEKGTPLTIQAFVRSWEVLGHEVRVVRPFGKLKIAFKLTISAATASLVGKFFFNNSRYFSLLSILDYFHKLRQNI